MIWGILHRTIFLELLRVFLLALFALTGLVLMAGIVAEATQRGLGPGQILAAIPLLLPSMLPYTLPTTTLFATCVVYGRLSADSEILAIKAAGVHIVHVIWPAILLGALTTIITLFLYLETIPVTHFILRSQIVSDVHELVYSILRKDGCFRHPRVNYTIHVKRIVGDKLIDAQFMRKSPDGQRFDVVAIAREAELRFDLKNKQILVNMRHCRIAGADGDDGFVEEKIWPVDMPPGFLDGFAKTRPTDMTWSELGEKRIELEAQKNQKEIEIANHQLQVNLGQAPSNYTKHVAGLQFQRRMLEQQILAIDTEKQMRPSFALGCLCFVLVGCPVGIWFSKSDYLSAFITCFLPIVIIYYPLMLCMINLARSGKVPIAAGLWLADGLMLCAAVVLSRRLARN